MIDGVFLHFAYESSSTQTKSIWNESIFSHDGIRIKILKSVHSTQNCTWTVMEKWLFFYWTLSKKWTRNYRWKMCGMLATARIVQHSHCNSFKWEPSKNIHSISIELHFWRSDSGNNSSLCQKKQDFLWWWRSDSHIICKMCISRAFQMLLNIWTKHLRM